MLKRGMGLLAAGALGLGACVIVSESESELVPGPAEAGTPDAAATDALTLMPDATPTEASADGGVDATAVDTCIIADGGELVVAGEPCAVNAQGTPFNLVGACKAGTWACVSLGGGARTATCLGATAPTAEVCTMTNAVAADEDCDGVTDNGCGCLPGTQSPCGTGICAGSAACVNGIVQPCTGQPQQARRCASSNDWNCNGVPDVNESGCRCTLPSGNMPAVGEERLCNLWVTGCTVVNRCMLTPTGTGATWSTNCAQACK